MQALREYQVPSLMQVLNTTVHAIESSHQYVCAKVHWMGRAVHRLIDHTLPPRIAFITKEALRSAPVAITATLVHRLFLNSVIGQIAWALALTAQSVIRIPIDPAITHKIEIEVGFTMTYITLGAIASVLTGGSQDELALAFIGTVFAIKNFLSSGFIEEIVNLPNRAP